MSKAEYHLYRAIHLRHPEDFKRDIQSWWLMNKLSPEDIRLILEEDVLAWCEHFCDNNASALDDPTVDCNFCHLLDLKPYLEKWMPEKAGLIGRYKKKGDKIDE